MRDKYLYKSPAPSHKIAVIGTGTIGQEHMRVATLLGRAQVHGIYDTQSHSMDVAEENFKMRLRRAVGALRNFRIRL